MIGHHVWLTTKGAGTMTAIDVVLTGSPADLYAWTIIERCVVIRVGFIIETAVSSSVSAVVNFDRIPNAGGSREAAFAALTIPTGATTGDYYYEEPSTTKTLYPGDIVICELLTVSDSAGTGHPFLIVEPIPERPANETQSNAG